MTKPNELPLEAEAPLPVSYNPDIPAILQRPVEKGAIATLFFVPGEVNVDDTGGPRWKIEGSPLAIVAAMKSLSGVISRQREVISFPATDANFEDLLMLMHRYPLRVDERARPIFEAGYAEAIRAHRARSGADREAGARSAAGIFKGELLPFQRTGVDFMFGMRKCLNADDMGLGKTIQAFAVLDELNDWPAVVVCQAHVVRHWEKKIAEFMDLRRAGNGLLDKAGLTWFTLSGSPSRSIPHASLYIVHYLNLHRWAGMLRDRGICTVIYDEVQEARHPGTRKHDAIRSVSRAAQNAIGLSGTPIYNRGIEIFNVMSTLSRGSLGTKSDFISTWCGKDPEVVEDPAALGRYLEDRGLMIRRRKEDVLTELPAKRRVIEPIDADNEEFAKLVREAAKLARKAETIKDPFDRARMEAEAIAGARRATGIAKAPAVVAFVRGLIEAGEPTLVFCHHHAVHDALLDALEEFKPATITGRDSMSGKALSQERFEKGETNLCIIALRAATGLDGLQKRARVVLFAELDWSPAIHKQAEDRAHRMGQVDSILAYYLVANLGTDPAMMQALELKESQFTGLMRDKAETLQDREAARAAAKVHQRNVLEMLRGIR